MFNPFKKRAGGGQVVAPSFPVPNPVDSPTLLARVLSELEAGYSIAQAAQRTGTSEVFVQVVLDHMQRLGRTASAQSLCSSGQGACHADAQLSVETQIACAGCFFAKKHAS